MQTYYIDALGNRRRLIKRRSALLTRHLEEKQKRQLLDISRRTTARRRAGYCSSSRVSGPVAEVAQPLGREAPKCSEKQVSWKANLDRSSADMRVGYART